MSLFAAESLGYGPTARCRLEEMACITQRGSGTGRGGGGQEQEEEEDMPGVRHEGTRISPSERKAKARHAGIRVQTRTLFPSH